jgi:hypothetical protein
VAVHPPPVKNQGEYVTLVVPCGPAGPAGPVEPVAPCGPVAPTGPSGPSFVQLTINKMEMNNRQVDLYFLMMNCFGSLKISFLLKVNGKLDSTKTGSLKQEPYSLFIILIQE